MIVWVLINHLGFELFPSFSDRWLGKWFISSDHPNLTNKAKKAFAKHKLTYPRLLNVEPEA